VDLVLLHKQYVMVMPVVQVVVREVIILMLQAQLLKEVVPHLLGTVHDLHHLQLQPLQVKAVAVLVLGVYGHLAVLEQLLKVVMD
jgi:hypothetical protein